MPQPRPGTGPQPPGENTSHVAGLPPGQARPQETSMTQAWPWQGTALAALMVFLGLSSTMTAAWLLSVIIVHTTVSGGLHVLCYVLFAVAGLQIASGLLMRRGHSWARALAIVLCMVNALGAFALFLSHFPVQGIGGITLNIGMIWLLTHPEAARWRR
jgi:hypothetical protein